MLQCLRAALFLSEQATAVVVLNLQASSSPIAQNNIDCIFNATTCPNGPYGLAELSNYGNSANAFSGTSLTYYLGSGGAPGYNLPFNKFDIEIDSASGNSGTDRLTVFDVFVNGNLEYHYTYNGTAGNIPGGNGNSNSDYRFVGIDLSGFALGSTVSFNVNMDSLTGGPESFIWYNGSSVTTVPEPGSVALLTTGLGILGWRCKRRSVVGRGNLASLQ